MATAQVFSILKELEETVHSLVGVGQFAEEKRSAGACTLGARSRSWPKGMESKAERQSRAFCFGKIGRNSDNTGDLCGPLRVEEGRLWCLCRRNSGKSFGVCWQCQWCWRGQVPLPAVMPKDDNLLTAKADDASRTT